jgi:hypothetical protein
MSDESPFRPEGLLDAVEPGIVIPYQTYLNCEVEHHDRRGSTSDSCLLPHMAADPTRIHALLRGNDGPPNIILVPVHHPIRAHVDDSIASQLDQVVSLVGLAIVGEEGLVCILVNYEMIKQDAMVIDQVWGAEGPAVNVMEFD